MKNLKKFTALFVTMAITFGFLFQGGVSPFVLFSKAAATFDGGTGTVSDPYLISTPEQLDAVRNNLSKCFKLENDIDLTAATSEGGEFYNDGKGWGPLGGSNSYFTGDFDGGNHEITGLNINRPDDTYVGLFAKIDDTIENLGVGGNIVGGQYTGAIVADNLGAITDCYNEASVSASNSINNTAIQLGGLAGSYGKIYNSYNAGTVTGNLAFPTSAYSYIGGLTGFAGKMTGCYNKGSVQVTTSSPSAQPIVGGLAGAGGPISGCYNIADITSAGSGDTGGIVGFTDDSVDQCYNTGAITGGNNIGGITGCNNGLVANCFNTANILCDQYNGFVGGISGAAFDTVAHCYNLGDIQAQQHRYYGPGSPDIAGYMYNQSATLDCYSRGANLAAMQQQSTYVGFDFDNTWVMVPGLFPRLQKFPYVPVTSVGFQSHTATLLTFTASNFAATVEPENATFKVLTCSSDNSNIAYADWSGQIHSGSIPGEATVTVTTVDGGFSDTCDVTVKQAVTRITLNKQTDNLLIGGTDTLTATVSPDNAANKEVIWSSGNPAVASVDQRGAIHALADGSTYISVTAQDGSNISAGVYVNVTTPVSDITLSETSAVVDMGQHYTLTATAATSAAENKSVTWASADSSIVTVDQSGNLTGVSPGQTTVTCTAQDGGGAAAVCTVTVPGIVVKTAPTTTQYVQGQSFNPAGGVITLYDENGNVSDIDMSFANVDGYISDTTGPQSLTVNYGGYSTTFTVTVIAKVVTGITLKSAPTQLNYVQGQSFNPSGGMITVHYNDSSTQDIALTSDMVYTFDSSIPNATETLEIIYDNYYINSAFTVYIAYRVVNSIVLKSPPVKTTYYQGESLDLAGAYITVTYNDGTSEDLAVTSDMLGGYNFSNPWQGSIYVTYNGQTTTFNVTVNVTVILLRILSGNPSITINRSNSTIYGFGVGTSVSSLTSMLSINGGTLHVYNIAGQEFTSGIVGTGATVKLIDSSGQVADQLTAVLHGDTNGDGSISITDLLQVESVILKKNSMSGAYAIAGDTNRDGSISITDLLQIESDILGKAKVAQ